MRSRTVMGLAAVGLMLAAAMPARANNLVVTNKVKMRALAVEMVYVAEGEFYAGSGGTESGAFTKTLINTADPTVTASGDPLAGGRPSGQTAPVATWPNGYNAFYCMKYEITQGQYKDFLNTLTSGQATTRYHVSTANRYTIAGTHPNFTAGAPNRACNFLSWADVAAFADWAGLRPMTDLEYEKACRGPLPPVANEYAWGSTVIAQLTGVANDGTGMESVSTVAGANCNYNSPLGGHVGWGSLLRPPRRVSRRGRRTGGSWS